MEINCTLLVQGVHFFFAYWALRVLLFKPSLMLIQQEHEETLAAHRALQEHEQKVEHARQRVDAAWKRCRSYFSEHAPKKSVDDVMFYRGIAPDVAPPHAQVLQRDKKSEDIAQIIIKKVDHVHQ